MPSNNVVTSSSALIELKSDLTQLSSSLHDIYDLLYENMVQVGEEWQDSQYVAFVEGYKPHLVKCEEISERYAQWCSKVLQPTIDNVAEVEKTDVGGGSGNPAATESVAGFASSAAAMAAVGLASLLNKKFNLGLKIPSAKPTTPQPIPQNDTNADTAMALEKNNKELEDALGVKQGEPMPIELADKQNANPNYTTEYIKDPDGDWCYYNGTMYKRKWLTLMYPETQNMSLTYYSKNPNHNPEFGINCATCAPAYALRLRGFDVTAKGNPQIDGNLNTRLSYHPYEIWKNADGTQATPTCYNDWMKEEGLYTMTANDYKDFFEENCKEQGVYEVTVKFKGGNGHATILQRDTDGKLYFIEPQVYEPYMTDDKGRRSLDDLVDRLSPTPSSDIYGVMRVDDKIFDPNYADVFQTNKTL